VLFESYVAPAAAAIAAVLFSLLLCASAVAAQSSVPRARYADGAIVKRGDTGATVKKVQRALGIEADGVYGIGTARAVDAFQARASLHRSGRVDRSTWRALFRAPVGSAGIGVDPDESGGSAPDDNPPPGEPAPPPAITPPAPGTCATALAAPLRGAVTKSSGFGDGRHHAGIDLTSPVGTPVRAAACGIVELAGTESGYGRIVCVRHTTTFVTCYAHLSAIARGKGAVVAQGQVIGRVGMTGRTSGPHLHFETRVDGTARDPEPYLAGTRAIPG
jgi:murein DD-endopeptidase MepM/ murein hydrolase activator NlpD